MKDPVESSIQETRGGGSGRDTSILLGEVTLSMYRRVIDDCWMSE